MDGDELKNLLSQTTNESFDFNVAPLMRVKVFILDSVNFLCHFNFHHIIFDEWSVNIFFKELKILYTSFLFNQPANLSKLPIQYADFTNWENSWLRSDDYAKKMAYWKELSSSV